MGTYMGKYTRMSLKQIILSSSFTTFVWATVSVYRMQESLSLPTFKRKQLRHEPYPSQPPPPPLGTRFLPLSKTDTQSVFFCPESRHIYQHWVRHSATPTTPAAPFPFLSLHLSVICWSGIDHWPHIQLLMWVQATLQ